MAPVARGADVAQLVEQLIRNEQVTGSNPAIGSIGNIRAFRCGYFLLSCVAGTEPKVRTEHKVRGFPTLPSAPFVVKIAHMGIFSRSLVQRPTSLEENTHTNNFS